MPSRFQLRGDSLQGIEWRLFNSHGNRARIVAAEKVTEGGIAGFFARTFYEVTVELRDHPDGGGPDGAGVSGGVFGGQDGMDNALTGIMIPDGWPIPAVRPQPGSRMRPRPHARSASPGSGGRADSQTDSQADAQADAPADPRPAPSGIEALLRDADEAEASAMADDGTDRAAAGTGAFEASGPAGAGRAGNNSHAAGDPHGAGRQRKSGAAVPRVSTGSGDFAALLEELTSTVSPDRFSANPTVPRLVSGPGKVVLVVGLGLDPVETARSMGTALGGAVEIRTAGARRAAGMDHVVGRNGLTAARTTGAAAGRTVVVAFGLRTDGQVQAPALSDLDADQVWLAVDAARKPADTASWARKVGWAIEVDALAVLGSQETLTPGTVNELDIPIGWVDGEPASKTTL
ncbi:MAG: hypothetical protein M3017_10025 [Actinomycetota bacterium]|nr:hypothetical protein [Actinomycetota bacterium]